MLDQVNKKECYLVDSVMKAKDFVKA